LQATSALRGTPGKCTRSFIYWYWTLVILGISTLEVMGLTMSSLSYWRVALLRVSVVIWIFSSRYLESVIYLQSSELVHSIWHRARHWVLLSTWRLSRVAVRPLQALQLSPGKRWLLVYIMITCSIRILALPIAYQSLRMIDKYIFVMFLLRKCTTISSDLLSVFRGLGIDQGMAPAQRCKVNRFVANRVYSQSSQVT